MEQVNPKPEVVSHSFLNRVKNIIAAPNKEWNAIALETPDTNRIIMGYVLPLAGAAAIAAFIGYALVGVSFFGVRVSGISWGLYQGLTVLLGGLLSVYIAATVLDMLAPSFDSEKNFGRSLQLVAYSYTPMWVGGLLAIIPALSLVGALFGLYGLYLLYLGMPKLKHTPEAKHVGYYVVSLLILIFISWVVGWILGHLFASVFGLSFGFHF